jgi:prolyl-tRNA synthetase
MGCYGIGVSRLVGTIAELLCDEKGLVWPENIAPFKVYLATIGEVTTEAQGIYDSLTKAGIEVLWDDRVVRPGEKFGDADLMGIPYRLVVSDKTVASGKHELKARTENQLQLLAVDDILEALATS